MRHTLRNSGKVLDLSTNGIGEELVFGSLCGNSIVIMWYNCVCLFSTGIKKGDFFIRLDVFIQLVGNIALVFKDRRYSVIGFNIC